MKKYFIIIVFYSFTFSFAQNDSVNNNSTEKFFITPTINYNLPGIGIKLKLGYNISNYFSIILSSGYMTSFTDPHSYIQKSIWDNNSKDYIETIYSDAEQTHQIVPIDLSLLYNFNVLGVQSYIFYQADLNFFLDEGNYDVTIVTKYKNSNQIIESKNGKAADIYNIAKTNSSFGGGIGTGILVPITDLVKIDISYLYNIINYKNSTMRIQSLGLGMRIIIK